MGPHKSHFGTKQNMHIKNRNLFDVVCLDTFERVFEWQTQQAQREREREVSWHSVGHFATRKPFIAILTWQYQIQVNKFNELIWPNMKCFTGDQNARVEMMEKKETLINKNEFYKMCRYIDETQKLFIYINICSVQARRYYAKWIYP